MSLTTEESNTEEPDDDGEGKDEPTMTSPRYNNITGRISSVTDLSVLGEPDFDEKACETNVCRNGGTCLATLTGPKCHCPLQYSGRQCEEEVQVQGFTSKRIILILIGKNNQVEFCSIVYVFLHSARYFRSTSGFGKHRRLI